MNLPDDYAKTLGGSPGQISWEALLAERESGTQTVARSLVLIHPLWYEGMPGAEGVRGPRLYGLKAGSEDSCKSELVFGYPCPFEEELHVDHLFPWSLGGPTVPVSYTHLTLPTTPYV